MVQHLYTTRHLTKHRPGWMPWCSTTALSSPVQAGCRTTPHASGSCSRLGAWRSGDMLWWCQLAAATTDARCLYDHWCSIVHFWDVRRPGSHRRTQSRWTLTCWSCFSMHCSRQHMSPCPCVRRDGGASRTSRCPCGWLVWMAECQWSKEQLPPNAGCSETPVCLHWPFLTQFSMYSKDGERWKTLNGERWWKMQKNLAFGHPSLWKMFCCRLLNVFNKCMCQFWLCMGIQIDMVFRLAALCPQKTAKDARPNGERGKRCNKMSPFGRPSL